HRALAARTLLLTRFPVSDCELVHTLLLKDEVGRSVGSSCPLQVKSSTPAASRRISIRKGSCLISCSHWPPDGNFIGFGWKTRGDEAGWKGMLAAPGGRSKLLAPRTLVFGG